MLSAACGPLALAQMQAVLASNSGDLEATIDYLLAAVPQPPPTSSETVPSAPAPPDQMAQDEALAQMLQQQLIWEDEQAAAAAARQQQPILSQQHTLVGGYGYAVPYAQNYPGAPSDGADGAVHRPAGWGSSAPPASAPPGEEGYGDGIAAVGSP